LNILLKLMSVVALVIAPSLTNTADIQNDKALESISNEQEENLYKAVESDEVVIYTAVIDFEISKANNTTLLSNLTLSNDLFCQSGGAKCDQFISNCTEPLVFEKNSSLADSKIDAYSYQVDGKLSISPSNDVEATAYYNVINENVISGQLAFNDITMKFKGKK